MVQRRGARRRKGRHTRRKALAALKCQHERIAFEDLRITTMVRNPHLATCILDAGWGSLIEHLPRNAEAAGRVVLLVDPRYTSNTCSRCGSIE